MWTNKKTGEQVLDAIYHKLPFLNREGFTYDGDGTESIAPAPPTVGKAEDALPVPPVKRKAKKKP